MTRNRDSAFRKDRTFNIINPIAKSTRDGLFKLSTTTLEKYKANLYTLLFTGVGERVMQPEFGTILKYLIFEQLTEQTYNNVKQDILDRTAYWIPEIDIIRISFGDELEDRENNKLSLKLDFTIKADPTIQDFIEIEMGV